MEHVTVDALARQVAVRVNSRRTLLSWLFGASATAAFGSVSAGKRSRKRRRRRTRRDIVQVCLNGQQLTVPINAIEAMLRVGAQFGTCGVPQGTQTCDDPRLVCSPNARSCGEGCNCVLTVGGGSMCAFGPVICYPQQSICSEDQDCIEHFGRGAACVPALACSTPRCGGNVLACARPCPPGPPPTSGE